MPLSLELHLDERLPDRVFVSVVLKPDGTTTIHGVELELQCRKHIGIGPRVLLPISGILAGPILTQAELRSDGGIPQGAMVVGTVWAGGEQLIAQCPTDPCTGLEGHVRGCPRLGTCIDDRKLSDLSSAECLAVRRQLPWIGEPAEQQTDPELEVTDDEMDDLCSDLGLDGDCAKWLKELMAEDA